MQIKTSTIGWTKPEIVEMARLLGYKYEQESHYCPQATLAALQDVFHVKDDNIFKACFGFHGGGGDSNDSACGALVGGTIMISYFFGRTRAEFDLRIENCQATGMVKKLHEYFEEEYGGIRCRDVHRKMFGREFNVWDENDLQAFLEMGGHTEKCPEVVGKGAAWAAGIIWDQLHQEHRNKRTRIKE
jgi:C_GCAxxG_C_C family probable redox protein